jgi:hypothetical protein
MSRSKARTLGWRRRRRRRGRRPAALVPAVAFALSLPLPLALAGCLGEPGIEDTWTRLDLSSPTAGESVAVGVDTLVVRGEVVYRSILTGFIVAEVRVSDVIAPNMVNLDADAERMDVLDDVDRILQNSTSAGFGAVPFTGWDHLIQDVNVALAADVPAPPPGGGVYLVLYLADGEEVELPTGEEVLVIDPFDFRATEVLPMGVELSPGGAP